MLRSGIEGGVPPMLLQNFLHSPSKPCQTSLRHALHCLPNESASSVPAHPTLTPAHNCRRCLLQSGHVPGHSVMFASTRWHRVPAQYRRLGLGGHSLFQENPKSSMLDMLITIPVLSREPAPVTPGATGSPGTGCSITGSITITQATRKAFQSMCTWNLYARRYAPQMSPDLWN